MRPQSVVFLGFPGAGKSTTAGSICEVVPPEEVLLLTAKPGEEKSWIYEKYGLTDRAEIFYDLGWRPSAGKFDASAYKRLNERLIGLREDERYGAVIIDPGTDVMSLIEHYLLAPSSIGSPGELSDTQGFYRRLKDTSQEFLLDHAAILASKLVTRPKWILIPWHTQPAKEGRIEKGPGGGRTKLESADEKGLGIEYEGNVLPQLEGAYRRKLAGDVDLVAYCDIEVETGFSGGKKTETVKYVVQLAPNAERHAKARASKVVSGTVPNSMTAIIEALEAANG